MKHRKHLFVAAAICAFFCGPTVQAVTTIFFSSSQTTNLVSTNATSDTISSEGYLFTYTRDKLFTGGTTNPPGRYVRIFWPAGLEAQYVTTSTNNAQITVRRVDGGVFDLTAFTAKLLANAGAGRAIEIVPLLNGQEPLNDPLFFDVSGNYGMEFSYDTSPNYLGTTAALTNYDAYVINLTLDYALMSLTVVDASLPPPPPPTLQISMTTSNAVQVYWPTNSPGFTLQQNFNLGTTNWVNATNSVSIVDTDYQVTMPTTNGTHFFRLKKP
jgi:hypothetical protein